MHIINFLLLHHINILILSRLIEILKHFTFLGHLNALLQIFNVILILETHGSVGIDAGTFTIGVFFLLLDGMRAVIALSGSCAA